MDALTEWNMLSQEYKCKSLHLYSTVTVISKVIRMQLKIVLSIDPSCYSEGIRLIDRLICCSGPFRKCSYMSATGTGSHQSARKWQAKKNPTFDSSTWLWEDRWEVFVVNGTLLQNSKTSWLKKRMTGTWGAVESFNHTLYPSFCVMCTLGLFYSKSFQKS